MTKELRIGNIVLARGAQSIVKSIDENHVGYSKSKKGEERIPIKLIQPIPLTEEWLVKFGFNHIDLGFESDQLLDIVIIFNSGVYEVTVRNEYTLTELKHVHQLQNLYFALTGEELTIKQ